MTFSPKFQITAIIAGKSEWQELETAGHVASTVNNREMKAPMFHARLLAFFTLHSSELDLGNGATHSGLGLCFLSLSFSFLSSSHLSFVPSFPSSKLAFCGYRE